MRRETYRLPNGKTTHSPHVYCRAWRRLAQPVCDIMHARLYGFDPGLLLARKNGTTIDVPVDLALAIGDLYRKAKGEKRDG